MNAVLTQQSKIIYTIFRHKNNQLGQVIILQYAYSTKILDLNALNFRNQFYQKCQNAFFHAFNHFIRCFIWSLTQQLCLMTKGDQKQIIQFSISIINPLNISQLIIKLLMEANNFAIIDRFSVEECRVSQRQANNTTFLYLDFSPNKKGKKKMSPKDVLRLSIFSWERLIDINLDRNDFGNEGCKYLSRVGMHNVKTVRLGKLGLIEARNRIEDVGIHHMSKADWRCLQSLYLIQNKFGTDSAKWLIRSKWPNIKLLNLALNKFTLEQLQKMLKHQFVHLSQFVLLDALNEEEEKTKIAELFEQKQEKTIISL